MKQILKNISVWGHKRLVYLRLDKTDKSLITIAHRAGYVTDRQFNKLISKL